jgi:hypothetical protein
VAAVITAKNNSCNKGNSSSICSSYSSRCCNSSCSSNSSSSSSSSSGNSTTNSSTASSHCILIPCIYVFFNKHCLLAVPIGGNINWFSNLGVLVWSFVRFAPIYADVRLELMV